MLSAEADKRHKPELPLASFEVANNPTPCGAWLMIRVSLISVRVSHLAHYKLDNRMRASLEVITVFNKTPPKN